MSILYLHKLGLSPAQTGALMLPWALASALGISLSRYQFNRLGPKPLLVLGMTAQALGIGLLTRIDAPDTWLPIALYGLMGFGGSLVQQHCAKHRLYRYHTRAYGPCQRAMEH
ncbi:MAG: hypothetical protein ACFWUJ_18430 [Pseudomonas fragi]